MNGKITTASCSISQELVGTLQMARYPLFQRLRRCTNNVKYLPVRGIVTFL
jgi:hypothetical protein